MRPCDSTRAITCCFTGHRPEKLPWVTNEQDPLCLNLLARLEASLERAYEAGKRHFICGMARGSDMLFFEAVMKLRSSRCGVRIEAAVPCPTQSRAWPRAGKERYMKLLAQSDMISVVSAKYDYDCMHRRNRYMVQNSSMLIAVFDGSPGGTSRTVAYAADRGLEIEILPPVL